MIKSIKNIFGLKSEFERLQWNDLRVIRTAWTVEYMNEAIEMGFTLHFVDYVQNPKIHSKLMLLKDAVTGKRRSVRLWIRPEDDPLKEEHILNDF